MEEKADNGAKNGSFDATGIPAFLYRFYRQIHNCLPTRINCRDARPAWECGILPHPVAALATLSPLVKKALNKSPLAHDSCAARFLCVTEGK
ncbi:MAG TPA: hypothetical protein VHB01_05610 [Nitrosospira sp.]|nr:hypothetical protein [Nitrosospira sp.]